MAKPRLKPSGAWELCVRHPALPGGRKSLTFDTEAEARSFGERWNLMKQAGLQPPAEMLAEPARPGVTLGVVLREFANSGLPAPSQQGTLRVLISEVGDVKLQAATYQWISGYVRSLKVGSHNLAPNSIRHRVQALGRAIDEYLRKHPDVVMQNPVRLLPKGYSTYSDVDAKLAKAGSKKVKVDVARDRRLHPGEEDLIRKALSGWVRDDRERGLLLKGGDAMLTMFVLITYTGLRLLEAFRLRAGWVDMDRKVIRVQSSKQWRGKVVFREVPMRSEVHQALTEYLKIRPHIADHDYLFPFIDEEPDIPISKVGARLSARFLTAFKYAGINDLHEHDLRHEATCKWLEMRDSSGNWMFRLEEVNRIMGWSANSVMAQRYASFRGADLSQRMWATQPAATTATQVLAAGDPFAAPGAKRSPP